MLKFLKKVNTKLFSDFIVTPTLLQPNHLPGLDGLRGVAIIIVLFSHFFKGSPYAKSFPGDTGVEIFFVISGFLITSLLLKEKIKTGRISLKHFYIRRILRILPLAYLFLIVLAILNACLSLKIPFNAFLSASLFYQNIPKLNTYNWFVAHFWSLSVEEQFYFTFPFLLVYDLNKYIKTIILIIVLVPIIALLGYTKTGIFYSNSIVHAAAFAIINLLSKTVCILVGSLLSIMMFKGFFQFKSNSNNRYFSLLLLIVAILIHTETSTINIPHCGLLLFPLIIGIVIILNLDKASILTRLLANPLITYIGLISYSLYIWQQLFSSPGDRLIKSLPMWQNLILMSVIAVVSYHLVEKPFIRLKKRIKNNLGDNSVMPGL
ncbi:acyltransferase [Mucilaginibacter rigui]|uniref:Acyltransferase n=1 Tax=Mucilaginibacter rigui TaxID=534635 RepID=A0ABR7X057_9SPHI|nr:acyltransferase [Mucilaginibacter rigui]MBD1383977.1 acyltransferase [Mucilaginibacter rigui]